MFSRLYIVGGVVLLIVAFFSYKIYSLNSKLKDTVASYESKLVEANATIKSLNEALIVSNVKEATEKANRAELEKAIAEANNLVNDLQAKNTNLSKELEEWSKRADVKDVIDYDKLDSCEDLLKLNEKISRMKYEDL